MPKKPKPVRYARPYSTLKLEHDLLTAMDIHGRDVTSTQYRETSKELGLTSLETISSFYGGFAAARERISTKAGLLA